MADGDNKKADEALAQAQAKIAELEKKVAELTKALETKTGIVDNAEAKFNEMAKETGDNRKAVTAAALELIELRKAEKEAQKNLAEASKALAELSKQGPPKDDGNKHETVEQQIAKIEASLTDDDLKKLDEARMKVSDERRREIDKGGAAYLALLRGLRDVQAESVDALPPWRKKPAQQEKAKPDGLAEEMKKLFRTESNRARNLPDGSRGGSPRTRSDPNPATHGGRTTNILTT